MKENNSETKRFEILKSVFNFDIKSNIKGIDIFDDAAIIPCDDEIALIIASDFVRGTGFTMFRNGLMDYFDIGYYLISANLSDIAAMGCKPIGLTNVFRYTKDLSNKNFERVLEGMKKACLDYNVIIVGGDIGSYQNNVLAATAFGFMKLNHVLLRSGAKKNDILCISGQIGLPFTALMYFEKAKKEGLKLNSLEEKILIDSWRRPKARIQCGLLLAQHKLANSCLDVSDGLKASIEQISTSSNLGFTINENKIPIHSITKKVSSYLKVSPLSMAFSASVDFSLLFTVSEANLSKTKSILSGNNIVFNILGETNNLGKCFLKEKNDNITTLPGLKWDHKSGNIVDQFYQNKNK